MPRSCIFFSPQGKATWLHPHRILSTTLTCRRSTEEPPLSFSLPAALIENPSRNVHYVKTEGQNEQYDYSVSSTSRQQWIQPTDNSRRIHAFHRRQTYQQWAIFKGHNSQITTLTSREITSPDICDATTSIKSDLRMIRLNRCKSTVISHTQTRYLRRL